ncbi:MAG: dihydrofolate reductase [Nocardioidaceae bacterium]|nr:MAG: dihydrofolate reductase [Nocardioidaceae bacterium]
MVLVAAVAENGVIARDGAIPWDLREDMLHFRRTTTGHAIIMGRTTYQEMGALPNRTSIVLTRDTSFTADDAIVVHTIDEALQAAARTHPGQPAMVVGGAQTYRLALEAGAQTQILSEVHQSPEGDTYYPEFDREEWAEERREPHDGFDIVWLHRKHA